MSCDMFRSTCFTTDEYWEVSAIEEYNEQCVSLFYLCECNHNKAEEFSEVCWDLKKGFSSDFENFLASKNYAEESVMKYNYIFVMLIIMYFYSCISIYLIAKRLDEDWRWIAFLPPFNFLYLYIISWAWWIGFLWFLLTVFFWWMFDVLMNTYNESQYIAPWILLSLVTLFWVYLYVIHSLSNRLKISSSRHMALAIIFNWLWIAATLNMEEEFAVVVYWFLFFTTLIVMYNDNDYLEDNEKGDDKDYDNDKEEDSDEEDDNDDDWEDEPEVSSKSCGATISQPTVSSNMDDESKELLEKEAELKQREWKLAKAEELRLVELEIKKKEKEIELEYIREEKKKKKEEARIAKEQEKQEKEQRQFEIRKQWIRNKIRREKAEYGKQNMLSFLKYANYTFAIGIIALALIAVFNWHFEYTAIHLWLLIMVYWAWRVLTWLQKRHTIKRIVRSEVKTVSRLGAKILHLILVACKSTYKFLWQLISMLISKNTKREASFKFRKLCKPFRKKAIKNKVAKKTP